MMVSAPFGQRTKDLLLARLESEKVTATLAAINSTNDHDRQFGEWMRLARIPPALEGLVSQEEFERAYLSHLN